VAQLVYSIRNSLLSWISALRSFLVNYCSGMFQPESANTNLWCFIGSMAPLSQSHIWIARQPFVYWEKSPDECLKLANLFSKNKSLTSGFSIWVNWGRKLSKAITFFRCLLCGMKYLPANSKRHPVRRCCMAIGMLTKRDIPIDQRHLHG